MDAGPGELAAGVPGQRAALRRGSLAGRFHDTGAAGRQRRLASGGGGPHACPPDRSWVGGGHGARPARGSRGVRRARGRTGTRLANRVHLRDCARGSASPTALVAYRAHAASGASKRRSASARTGLRTCGPRQPGGPVSAPDMASRTVLAWSTSMVVDTGVAARIAKHAPCCTGWRATDGSASARTIGVAAAAGGPTSWSTHARPSLGHTGSPPTPAILGLLSSWPEAPRVRIWPP